MSESSRVVITGLGCASAAGLGLEELIWGLSETSPLEPGRVNEVMELHVEEFIASKQNYLDRHSQLCFAAATPALEESELTVDDDSSPHLGLAVGNSLGNIRTVEAFVDTLVNKGGKYVSPFLFTHAYPNSSASLLAIEYNLKGTMVNLSAGATSGLAALVVSADYVAQNASRAIVALGADAPGRIGLLGEALAAPDAPPLAEGAGAIVLEQADHAEGRGAPIHADVVACAMVSGPVDSAAAVDHLLGQLVETVCTRGLVTPSDVHAAFVDGAPIWASGMADKFTLAGTSCPVVLTERITGRALAGTAALSTVLAACALSGQMDDLSAKVIESLRLPKVLHNVLIVTVEAGGNAVAVLLRKAGA